MHVQSFCLHFILKLDIPSMKIYVYIFFSTISSYLKTSYITIVSVESIAVVRPEGWSPAAKRPLELFGHRQREMVVIFGG